MATEDRGEEMLRAFGREKDDTAADSPDVPPAIDERMDDRALGRQMARILKTGAYHPVVMVGCKASGKTTLVASLLARAYASDHGDSVDFRLAQECLFPEQHPRYAEIQVQTRRFYDGTVVNLADWQLAARTAYRHPFYIPIEMVPRVSRLPPVKFAFLECGGEAFTPSVEKVRGDSTEVEYLTRSKFPEEISSVLANFNLPISFIYVAPCSVQDDVRGMNRRKADLALWYSMERVQGIRGRSGLDMRDQHLLLLSMWDTHTGGVGASTFARPGNGEIQKVLSARFPETWKKYCSMRPGPSGLPYQIMQYSAGPVAEGQFARVAEESHPVLNRYPRTVLNWLYGNATPGRVLFPDVVEQPPRRRTLIEKIMNLVVEGSFR